MTQVFFRGNCGRNEGFRVRLSKKPLNNYGIDDRLSPFYNATLDILMAGIFEEQENIVSDDRRFSWGFRHLI